mgnify:CR=1 FL=1
MELEDIISTLTRVGFKEVGEASFGISKMGLSKSVNGKEFYYWFGPNTDGYLTMTKQSCAGTAITAPNFLPIRADGNVQIEILISGEFPNEYKEYKRNYKLNQLGITN